MSVFSGYLSLRNDITMLMNGDQIKIMRRKRNSIKLMEKTRVDLKNKIVVS